MTVVRIDDADDPRLADYRDLKDGGLRLRRGSFIAESRQVVRTLLTASPYRARSVLLTEAALGGLKDVLDDGIPVYLARDETIRGVVGFAFHRGCLAAGERPPDVVLDALLPARLLLVLERVTNPDNVGAVFRSAMAFGADGVLLSPGSADPLYRKAIRVSMGGTLRVPFARLDDWPTPLARLRDAGFTVVALAPDATLDIAELDKARATGRTALLLGAEEDGLSAAARACADVEVAIRMAPGADSLNVATAAAIALHRLAHRSAGNGG
jgi:tRNA G18 (ribose-2'-O)-methylase SpoU